MEIIKNGLYRHYKGKNYKLIDIVKHSETQEDLILYQCMYHNDSSVLWVRPISNFFSKVTTDGIEVDRFSYIGDIKGNERL